MMRVNENELYSFHGQSEKQSKRNTNLLWSKDRFETNLAIGSISLLPFLVYRQLLKIDFALKKNNVKDVEFEGEEDLMVNEHMVFISCSSCWYQQILNVLKTMIPVFIHLLWSSSSAGYITTLRDKTWCDKGLTVFISSFCLFDRNLKKRTSFCII